MKTKQQLLSLTEQLGTKKNMTVPDFLRWIANCYSEEEISRILEKGVECGFDKFCQKMAYSDIMAILDL